MIYDVIQTFGELSDEAQQNRKYAKWKAAYIHNCLKNGETPISGPMKSENEEEEDLGAVGGQQPPMGFIGFQPQPPSTSFNAPAPAPVNDNDDPFSNLKLPSVPKDEDKQPGGW